DVGAGRGDAVGDLGQAGLVGRVDLARPVVDHLEPEGLGRDLGAGGAVQAEVAGNGGDGDGRSAADVVGDVADGVLDLDAVRRPVVHQVGVVLGVDPARVPGERNRQDVVLLVGGKCRHRVRGAGRLTDHRHLVADLLVLLEVGRHVVGVVLDHELDLEPVDAAVAVAVLPVHLVGGDDLLHERRERAGQVRQQADPDDPGLQVHAHIGGDVAGGAALVGVGCVGRGVLADVAAGVGGRFLGGR